MTSIISTSTEKLKSNYKADWVLKNVTNDGKTRIESKNFSVRLGKKTTKWSLKLTFNKETNGLEVYLFKKKVPRRNFLINFIFNINGKEFQWEKKSDEITSGNWGWPFLLKLDDLFNETKAYVDKSGRLKLSFEVKLTELDEALSELNASACSQGSKCETCSHYFEDKSYSDFTLICSDDVSIPVHRLFLAKKSRVFKEMFDVNQHEQKTMLKDINSETMKEVLRYIYCGSVFIEDVKLLTNVLHAAKTYEILELITQCIDGLMEQVNQENVMDILDIADSFGQKELEKKCLSVILKHYMYLKETEMWKDVKLPLILKIMDAAIDTTTHLTYQTLPKSLQ